MMFSLYMCISESMIAQKWFTKSDNFYKQVMAELPRELSDLITEEAGKHLRSIIILNHENINQKWALYFNAYLKALETLYEKKGATGKLKAIEKNFQFLERNHIFLIHHLDSKKKLRAYSEMNQARLDAVELLRKGIKEKNLRFDDIGAEFKPDLDKLRRHLIKINHDLFKIESHLRRNGPKTNFLLHEFATKLISQFSVDFEKCPRFKVDSVENCFNYIPEKGCRTLANEVNLTVLALNLIIPRINKRSLNVGIKSYNRSTEKLKKENDTRTMSELVDILYGDKKVTKYDALIDALRKHSWQILHHSS